MKRVLPQPTSQTFSCRFRRPQLLYSELSHPGLRLGRSPATLNDLPAIAPKLLQLESREHRISSGNGDMRLANLAPILKKCGVAARLGQGVLRRVAPEKPALAGLAARDRRLAVPAPAPKSAEKLTFTSSRLAA